MSKFQNIDIMQGQAAITAVIFLLMIMLSIFGAISFYVLREARGAELGFKSRTAFFAAEAGVDDAVYRFKRGKIVASSFSLNLNEASATTTVSSLASGDKEILSSGNFLGSIRGLRGVLSKKTGADFHFGAQAGEGGIRMDNNSRIEGVSGVVGNVYSNGPIEGDSGATVTGDVISAGAQGLIDDVVVSGSAYAHEIKSSRICGDAYYQIIDQSSFNFLQNPSSPTCASLLTPGTAFPGSVDQDIKPSPISTSTITIWKDDAAAGGTISGNCGDSGNAECKISNNGTLFLGPKKITGNLILTKKQTLIVTGTLYFAGNIDIDSTSGATVKCDSSFGADSCVVIADGWIHIRNSAVFQGSGSGGSYILILSTKKNCNGGSQSSSCTHHNAAIDLHNNALGAVFYAGDSMVYLHNGVEVSQLTANRIELENNAIVRYETGLSDMKFSSGPSGKWDIIEWKEVIQ